MRLFLPVALIAALGLAAPAGATVATLEVTALNTNAAPTPFSFDFAVLLIPTTGPLEVSLSIGGAFGDFARDGAAVTPSFGSTIASVSLGAGPVVSAGGAASFAGAGGTAGTVLLAPFGIHNIGGFASQFSNSFATPIVPRSSRTESQGAVAGAVVDGFTLDGATLTGAHPGNSIAAFTALSGVSPVPGAFAIGGPTVTGGDTFSATGSSVMECTTGAPCTTITSEALYMLTGGGDAAAMVMRQELGGDPISGTVVDEYEFQTASAVYDCSTLCTFFTVDVDFTLSGFFDAAAFVLRVEVNPATVVVPEPAALSLFATAFAALGLARRRRAA